MLDDREGWIPSPNAHLGGARGEIIRALRTLSGIPTPDGTHPTGRHFSLLRTRIGGAIFTLAGLITAYIFILKPVEEATHTGVLRQGLFGSVMPVVLVYGGIAQLVMDLRDEKSLRIGEDGRLWWTRRARVVIYGMWGATALAMIVWYLYVRNLGLNPF